MSDQSVQYLDFLLEIGCEEVPAGVVPVAAQALQTAVIELLDSAGILHGDVEWLGTPRRMSLCVAQVGPQQPDRAEVLTGPPIKAARGADGQWTQAALGFARGQNVDISALFELETAKGPYLAAHRTTQGQPTLKVLAQALPGILRNLPFPKKMRWGTEREPFIRPVHWLVALLGETVIPFEFAGISSGNQARGHRFWHDQFLTLPAQRHAYVQALRQARVMVDPAERKNVILQGIHRLAAEVNGKWVEDFATLDVVVQLTEWPEPLLGTFDPAYLAIPAPVIRTTLRENQKLFTLTGPDGKLLNYFIAVANTLTEESRSTVATGNARVVSARLADARFFVQEDTRQPLADYRDKLHDRVYLQGLGSILQRADRIAALAQALAPLLAAEQQADVARAARLCKADLSTRMVFEFPELQGFVGADYAERQGESATVVRAITEHYQPRFAGDAMPQDAVGACVALADKIEAVVGCFALGLLPTGAQDPYALRRQALGILRILADRSPTVRISVLVEIAVDVVLPALQIGGARVIPEAHSVRADVTRFLRGRLLAMMQAEFPTDLTEAVLEAEFDQVDSVRPRLQAIAQLKTEQGERFGVLTAAFKRVGNIVRKQGGEVGGDATVDPKLFELPAEHALQTALTEAASAVQQAMNVHDYPAALRTLAAVGPAVDEFFTNVMVMCDQPAVRRNRLALLHRCADLFAKLADFSRIGA